MQNHVRPFTEFPTDSQETQRFKKGFKTIGTSKKLFLGQTYRFLRMPRPTSDVARGTGEEHRPMPPGGVRYTAYSVPYTM